MLVCCITGNCQALSTARFWRESINASWYWSYFSVIWNGGRPRPTQEFIYSMDSKETPIKLKQYRACTARHVPVQPLSHRGCPTSCRYHGHRQVAHQLDSATMQQKKACRQDQMSEATTGSRRRQCPPVDIRSPTYGKFLHYTHRSSAPFHSFHSAFYFSHSAAPHFTNSRILWCAVD